MAVPSWIPYTAFILITCALIGFGAHAMSEDEYCPWHAFKYAGADSLVSRAEWGEFLCEGCHQGSYCLSTSHPLQPDTSSSYYPRTCGDGSVEAAGSPTPVGSCKYTFASLDAPWRHTSMRAEYALYRSPRLHIGSAGTLI